jgi:hypothetical protein
VCWFDANFGKLREVLASFDSFAQRRVPLSLFSCKLCPYQKALFEVIGLSPRKQTGGCLVDDSMGLGETEDSSCPSYSACCAVVEQRRESPKVEFMIDDIDPLHLKSLDAQ